MTFPVPTLSAGNSGANVTSYPIPLPDNLTVGQLLLVAVAKDGTGGVTFPASPAWTLMSTPSSDSHALAVRWHRVDGSEGWGGTGNSITVTGASEGYAHVVILLNGAHLTSAPFNPTAVVDNAGSTAPDAPAANPGTWDVEDTLWLDIYGWDGNVSHSAYPSGFDTAQITDRWANANGCGIAVSARQERSASVDPAAGTLSGAEEWCAVTVAIRPAVPDPAATVGTLDVILPALSVAAAGELEVAGTLEVTLPALTVQLDGEISLPPAGTLDVTLPALAALLSGELEAAGSADVTLPALEVNLAGELEAAGSADVTLPALEVNLAGVVEVEGVAGILDVTLPALAAELTGTVEGVDLMTLLGEAAQYVRQEVADTGVRAVLNLTDINPPCVWVQLRRVEHNYLAAGVYTAEWNLYLLAPDTGDMIRTYNTLGGMSEKVIQAFQSSEPVDAVEVQLTGDANPKPALRFIVRTHVTP